MESVHVRRKEDGKKRREREKERGSAQKSPQIGSDVCGPAALLFIRLI